MTPDRGALARVPAIPPSISADMGSGPELRRIPRLTVAVPAPEVPAAPLHVPVGLFGTRVRSNNFIAGLSLLIGDATVAFLTVQGVESVRSYLWGPTPIPWGFPVAVLFWMGIRASYHLYPGIGIPGPEVFRRGTLATVLAGLLHGAMLLASGSDASSRFITFGSWLALIPFAWLARSAMQSFLLSRGRYGTPVVVVGGGDVGSAVIRELKWNRELGLDPVAVFEDDASKARGSLHGVPVLGPLEVALNGVVPREVRHVVLAMQGVGATRLEEIVHRLRERYPRVVVVPNVLGRSNLWARATAVGPFLSVEFRNNLLERRSHTVKRVFDLAFGIPLFLMSVPVIALAAIAVFLVDGGPVFYAQVREGYGGRKIRMWKIRTMVRGAEEKLEEHLAEDPEARREWESRKKLEDDPRVIRFVGPFLRKYSLDELPQLWNMLRGEMSLVGPRPFPEYHLAEFPLEFRDLRRKVLPGLSGYWQVTVRSNGDLDGQQIADEYYIHNWSLWLDLWILHKTVGAVLSGEGAR